MCGWFTKNRCLNPTFRKMDLYLYALFWCSIDIVIFILLSEERKMPSERIYIKELHNLFLVHSFLLLFCDIKNLIAMLMWCFIQPPPTGSSSQEVACKNSSAAVPVNSQTSELPECDWSEHTCPDGHKYYYNCVTCESLVCVFLFWLSPSFCFLILESVI